MVRRTFRFGLRAGLLAGIVIALIKVLQSRRASQEAAAPPSSWPRVPTSAAPSPSDAAEPGLERPAASAATKLAPEPLTPAEPSVSTPPAAPASSSAPGTITQQPAGRVRPLKATKAPAKATKKASEPEPGNRTWIKPISDDLCPQSHPVKAKMASRIFHIPGGQNYARCRPDRCYESEQAAEADGFSRSKR